MNDVFVAGKQKITNAAFLPDSSSDMNALSDFCKNPKGVSFQTQKAEETILLFLRAHFLTNLSWIFLSLFLIIPPIIISIFLPSFGINLLSSPAATRFTTVIILLYYLLIFSYILISLSHWIYNVFIVSSERIVDIDYSDIVVHNIAITRLSHIEDVNYTQSGFISTLFNYGNLFVQTAGNEKNFEALSIPKPREATHIIGGLIGKYHSGDKK